MKKSFTTFRQTINEKADHGVDNHIDNNIPQKYPTPSYYDKPVFVMNPPFSFSCEVPINIYMKQLSPKERTINIDLAIEQWHTLYDHLTSVGIVYTVPAKEGLQDQPFVANLGVILHDRPNLAIISNYKKETRRGETPVGVEFFKMLGYETVVAPKFFEGEAELKWIKDDIYVGGYGVRTTINALEWFEETYGITVIKNKAPNDYSYHLDCLLQPINHEAVITDPKRLQPETLKELEKLVAIEAMTNNEQQRGLEMICVNKLIMTHDALKTLKHSDPQYDIEKDRLKRYAQIASKYGMDFKGIDISEFEKSGAGLACLVMHLNDVGYLE